MSGNTHFDQEFPNAKAEMRAIYLGNLPFGAPREEVEAAVTAALHPGADCKFYWARPPLGHYYGEHKGWCQAVFDDADAATDAIYAWRNLFIRNRRVRVQRAVNLHRRAASSSNIIRARAQTAPETVYSPVANATTSSAARTLISQAMSFLSLSHAAPTINDNAADNPANAWVTAVQRRDEQISEEARAERAADERARREHGDKGMVIRDTWIRRSALTGERTGVEVTEHVGREPTEPEVKARVELEVEAEIMLEMEAAVEAAVEA